MANTKWKDFLLKSGLPLEYEIKELLEDKGCITSYEFSYLRSDENKIINEFSYDISASYIKKHHFFNLMVECKYRDESTNWLFVPGQYGGPSELETTSFLHPSAHFTKKVKFPYNIFHPTRLAPACLKGIEITSDGQNPKSITQAVSQLSYAMAENIVDGMYHQIDALLSTSEVIFYDVPIIVTTANLFRIKENITISDIKKNQDITDIAVKEDCLILDYTIGKDLQKHNQAIFNKFIEERSLEELNSSLNSFNNNVEFVFDVIASTYSPQAVLIINHGSESKALEKLFDFLNDIVTPSEATIKDIADKKARIDGITKKIHEMKRE